MLFNGHGGGADGFVSELRYNRDTGLGYFVSINALRPQALTAIRREIEGWIVAQLDVPPPPRPTRLPEEMLQRYAGDYELAAWRFPWTTPGQLERMAMRVTLEGGRLYTRIGGRKAALIPIAEKLFRRRGEPTATSAFAEDVDGSLYFQEKESWRKQD